MSTPHQINISQLVDEDNASYPVNSSLLVNEGIVENSSDMKAMPVSGNGAGGSDCVSEAWNPIPSVVYIKIENTINNGNCFIYALMAPLQTFLNIKTCYSDMKELLQNKALQNLYEYMQYVAMLKVKFLTYCMEYFDDKQFN